MADTDPINLDYSEAKAQAVLADEVVSSELVESTNNLDAQPQSGNAIELQPTWQPQQIHCEYLLEPKHSQFQYHFALFDECYLRLEKRCAKSQQTEQIAFHVGLLEPQPKCRTSTAWMTFTGAILTALAAATIGLWRGDWWLAGATAAFSLLLFLIHYFSFRKESIFFSRAGKAPLLSLNHRCQCEQSLQQFMNDLEQRISANTLPASESYFSAERHWLQELSDQGWISEQQYQRAKKRIVSQCSETTE